MHVRHLTPNISATLASTPMFHSAIFDMDGLLLDSERPILEAWETLARELGFSIDPALYRQVIGRREADVRAILTPTLDGRIGFDEACAEVRRRVARRTAEGYAVKPGVLRLLCWLREEGVGCAVASSTRRLEVERRLRTVGLFEFFDVIVGGDDVIHPKPAPDPFLLAAERIGTDPGACLAFEDSEHGARSALAAGMQVVVVPDLIAPPCAIVDAALAVLDSLHHAIEHCPTWFAVAAAGSSSF